MWAWLITSKVGRWAAIAGAVVVAFLTLRGKIRSEARQDMELEQRRETDKRVEAGRSASRDTQERLADADTGELNSELRSRGL